MNQNFVVGWADKLSLPPQAWFDLSATRIISLGNQNVVFNHESWPRTTQEDRVECSRKFAYCINQLRLRVPSASYGVYEYVPRRDLFRAVAATTTPEFIAWQAENNDMVEMAAAMDFFCPSLYFFYTLANNGAPAVAPHGLYFERNIDEAKRLRGITGSPTRPIYPFVWWIRHGSETERLDMHVYTRMLRTCRDRANGFVLWGGWQQPWIEGDEWWTFTKAILSPRCVVSLNGVYVDPNGKLSISYNAAINEPAINWGGSAIFDPGEQNPSALVTAQCVADALNYSVTILPSQVVLT